MLTSLSPPDRTARSVPRSRWLTPDVHHKRRNNRPPGGLALTERVSGWGRVAVVVTVGVLAAGRLTGAGLSGCGRLRGRPCWLGEGQPGELSEAA